jgi:hypothetical protein
MARFFITIILNIIMGWSQLSGLTPLISSVFAIHPSIIDGINRLNHLINNDMGLTADDLSGGPVNICSSTKKPPLTLSIPGFKYNMKSLLQQTLNVYLKDFK